MDFDAILSELRGALEHNAHREAARLLLAYRTHERFDDLLAYACSRDAELLAPSRLAQWAVWGPDGHEKSEDGLWWVYRDSWSLNVCGVWIADHNTVDLITLQVEWSTVPARHVLHYWEDWARQHAPHSVGFATRVLDLADLKFQGVLGDEQELEDAVDLLQRATFGQVHFDNTMRATARAIISAALPGFGVDSVISDASDAIFMSRRSNGAADAQVKLWSAEWTAFVIQKSMERAPQTVRVR